MGDDVVVERLGGTELKDNGVSIDGSEEGALNIFDNLDGDTVLEFNEVVTQTVREWETRSVTTTRQTDVNFNLNIVGIYKGVKAEANFFVGHSTSEVVETNEGFDEQRTLEREISFDVLPGTKKIVRVSYRTYDYEYRFSGTAQCIYQSDPDTVFPGGIAEGELLGSEAVSGIEFEINTETKDGDDVTDDGDGTLGTTNALDDPSSGTAVSMRPYAICNVVLVVIFGVCTSVLA